MTVDPLSTIDDGHPKVPSLVRLIGYAGVARISWLCACGRFCLLRMLCLRGFFRCWRALAASETGLQGRQTLRMFFLPLGRPGNHAGTSKVPTYDGLLAGYEISPPPPSRTLSKRARTARLVWRHQKNAGDDDGNAAFTVVVTLGAYFPVEKRGLSGVVIHHITDTNVGARLSCAQ